MAGKEYRKLIEFSSPLRDKLDILGVVTTTDIGIDVLDGYKVIRPIEINPSEMDYVIIAIGAWREVAELLIAQGIDKTKIIRSSVFYRAN